MSCGIDKSIALNADESEAKECECCFTEISDDDLRDDVCNDCSYEIDANLDNLTSRGE